MLRNIFSPILCRLAFGMLLASTLIAAEPFNPYKNPNDFLSRFYEQNRDAINQLESTVRNSDASIEVRIKALQQLNDEYPDVALPLLAELITGDSEPLAARAALLMGNASMMMNHKMYGDTEAHEANPYRAYLMEKHELIFNTLRNAVQDERSSVRNKAASVLTSQSDEQGLERISEGRKKELYTDEEFVELFILGSPEATGKYLAPYLDSASPEVKASVGAYLAESTAYASLVVDKVLLSESVSEETKSEVVRHISDLEVLMPILVSPNAPASLFSDVLGTYIERRGDRLGVGSIEFLLDGVNQREVVPGSKLQTLKNQLQDLYQQKM